MLVQCDEQQPTCGLCKKVKKLCSLASDTAESTTSKLGDEFTLPSNASPIFGQASPSLQTRHGERLKSSCISIPAPLSPPHLQPLPIADLEVLYKQMRHNQAIGRDGDDIQIGFAFPYVLHSTLSLSALQIFSEQPSRTELLDRACAHQNSALTLVRPHLLDINERNVEAVVELRAITSVIALAQPLYQHPYRVCRRNDPIDDMLNSFHMTRGIRTVLERQWQIDQVKFDPDAGPALDDEDAWQQDLMSKYPPYPVLRDVINIHCTIEEDILVCLDATRKIFSFITLLEEYPNLHPDARLVRIWPIEIKKRFLDMPIARKLVALLVLGYYSVLMRLRSDTMWPFNEWPSKLLQRMEEILGHEWLEYLEWPKSRVLDLIDEEECVLRTSALSC